MKNPLFYLALLLLISSCNSTNTSQALADSTNTIANEQNWLTIQPGADTVCSDGSPYSFHVKPGEQDKLFIFLNGGGACYNSQTCEAREGNDIFIPRADLPHNDPRMHDGVFNLNNPNNPIADWSMLFVSYCTGDIHLGSATRSYKANDDRLFSIYHHGAKNAESALNWAGENFSPNKIIVAGSSAGALAAPVYAGQVAELYPNAELSVFADGAAGYRSRIVPSVMAQWNVAGTISDEQYPNLNMSEANFYSFYEQQPDIASSISSYALFDTADDQVQNFFRSIIRDQGQLEDAIRITHSQIEDYNIAVSHYLASGDYHTILRFDRLYQEGVGNINFLDWFKQFIDETNPDSIDCITTDGGC